MDGKETHENTLNIISHRKMQIKATIRCHYTPTKVAKIKAINNTKCLQERGAIDLS